MGIKIQELGKDCNPIDLADLLDKYTKQNSLLSAMHEVEDDNNEMIKDLMMQNRYLEGQVAVYEKLISSIISSKS